GLRSETMVLVEAAPAKKQVVAVGGAEAADEVEHFLQRGRGALKQDPQTAYRMFKVASDLNPSDGRATEGIREAEREIKSVLARDGVSGEKVPELAITISEITERTFSPHEGFVLSRINGQWDVKSIMKISPMKELDVLVIFQNFLRDGVIRWKARK
ncbi:MAG TPA: hypothetical protein VE078_03490, partial [Thermoanaerobaculia bacterium]|nr:hypothetical protein [Thermoanaerobaculia bacterium]